ncbi:MAG: LamG domain-containing protein [Sedimentisphaerales bacterium]|nr:LamG domain-containing protein [Sedimentisphaerales bacterium]
MKRPRIFFNGIAALEIVLMRVFVLTALTGIALGAPPAYQTAVQNSNPLLYYQLNETTGPALNHGSLGPAFDGQYFGTIGRQTATAQGDMGVSFDSSDDYLESLSVSPASLNGNATFTIETVIFLATNSTALWWPPFLHWGDGGGNRTGKEVFFSLQRDNANRVYVGFYNGGLRTRLPLTLGQWYHLVMVRQGGSDSSTGTTLYINGQSVPLEVDSDLFPGVLVPALTVSTFRINRARDVTRYFTGIMDEVALYGRVLTAEEVNSHFATMGNACLARPIGDINLDCRVDLQDLALLAANWLQCGLQDPTACP